MNPSTPDFKPMPLASVIYAVTFDQCGLPIVQAKIHTDTAGRGQFTGDPGRAYTMLSAALDITSKRLADTIANQLMRAAEEKRLLNAELLQEEPVDSPFNAHPNSLP